MTSQPSILELGTSSERHLLEVPLFILSLVAFNNFIEILSFFIVYKKYANKNTLVKYK